MCNLHNQQKSENADQIPTALELNLKIYVREIMTSQGLLTN